MSLEDTEYRQWCIDYQSRGGEIALHGVSSGDNTREEVARGLDQYEQVLGSTPKILLFHKHNAENMYWGESFSNNPVQKMLVRTLVPTRHEIYLGHDPSSKFYSGDLMWEKVQYTRLFRTRNLNILSKNPNMPFHLCSTPLTRFWFCATAQDLEACKMISNTSLSGVARNDGLVLIYAHMAEKFITESGDIHPLVKRAFTCVGERNDCWKASVSRILDRCFAVKNLIVTHQRTGVVLSNPTGIVLENVQLQSRGSELYLSTGEKLKKDPSGIFILPILEAKSSISLFSSSEAAEIDDPNGMPRRELFRMKLEELKRLLSFRQLYRFDNQTAVPESELEECDESIN